MGNLTEVLKVFIDKHLIPTIISVILAIGTLLIMPINHWIILKIGKNFFIVLAFCVYFLIVQFLVKIKSGINKVVLNIKNKNYTNKHYEEENRKVINSINEYVDSLIPQDKEILITFIKNNNKILIASERMGVFNHNDLLSNSEIINVSTYLGGISNIDKTNYWVSPDLEEIINMGMKPLGLKQYKIKDNLFSILQYVYKSTGKLGNF